MSVKTYTDDTLTTQVGVASVGTVSVTADADMKPTLSAGWAAAAACLLLMIGIGWTMMPMEEQGKTESLTQRSRPG